MDNIKRSMALRLGHQPQPENQVVHLPDELDLPSVYTATDTAGHHSVSL